ncbi:winged helix-turn-helix transcriptional regulator [Fuscibacter oryzae]|uniref:Helix-turn-helix transcriptional regulator n=1 Tax=Fuscibacter oryzae TaxID=2803939 RepID=A0A8J7MRL0_9RHOB|nr:helix-turn-helix domain-containing protein [Fuscibacter oryzae]MBL4928648.1 helix-turn-helix transcriptional regulator [Fuscibacter oryzae]
MNQISEIAAPVAEARCASFDANCPARVLFDQIADKWSMMILTVLDRGPQRFNTIRRSIEGVSQKSLTQTLRKLERNGLITRRVLPGSPVAVEYEMSDLGWTVLPPFRALYRWTKEHMPEVEAARAAFDRAG